jgi:hypothetical protein
VDDPKLNLQRSVGSNTQARATVVVALPNAAEACIYTVTVSGIFTLNLNDVDDPKLNLQRSVEKHQGEQQLHHFAMALLCYPRHPRQLQPPATVSDILAANFANVN